MIDGSCSSAISHLPIRSTLARTVLSKIEYDRCLQSFDRNQWYQLSRIDLLDERVREKFHRFHEDEETRIFLSESRKKSDNIPLQLIFNLLTAFFTFFITRTSGRRHCQSGELCMRFHSSQWSTRSWWNVRLFH